MGQGKVSPFPRVWSPGVRDTAMLLSAQGLSGLPPLPKGCFILTLIVFPSVHRIFSLIQTDSSVRLPLLMTGAYSTFIAQINVRLFSFCVFSQSFWRFRSCPGGLSLFWDKDPIPFFCIKFSRHDTLLKGPFFLHSGTMLKISWV